MSAASLDEEFPTGTGGDVAELAARRASTWTDPAGPLLGTHDMAALDVGAVVEMMPHGHTGVAMYEIVTWTDDETGDRIKVARQLGHRRHEDPAAAVEAGRALVHGVTVVGRLIRR